MTIGGVSAQFDVTTAAANQPTATGLVAWWRAENNAFDAVGGNHGTQYGGTNYTAGRVGQSFNFDGVDNYIQVPANGNSKLALGAGDFAVEFWVFGTTNDDQQPQVSNHQMLREPPVCGPLRFIMFPTGSSSITGRVYC